MSKYKQIMSLTMVLFVAFIGAATAPQDAAQQQMPHWELLQQQFKGMLNEDVAREPYSQIDKLKQLLKKEKIGDHELAYAVLKFMSQNKNADEGIILVMSTAMWSATEPSELARVWTAALGTKEKNTPGLGMLLELLEHRENDKRSFELYTSLLAEKPDDMPLALVEYMYTHDPSQAFLSIVNATRNVSPKKKQESDQRERELQFSHHMIEHAVWFLTNDFKDGREEAIKAAIGQLTKFADAPEWWVRLYTAFIVQRYPELGTPTIIEKLKRDKHPLVHNVLSKPVEMDEDNGKSDSK